MCATALDSDADRWLILKLLHCHTHALLKRWSGENLTLHATAIKQQ